MLQLKCKVCGSEWNPAVFIPEYIISLMATCPDCKSHSSMDVIKREGLVKETIQPEVSAEISNDCLRIISTYKGDDKIEKKQLDVKVKSVLPTYYTNACANCCHMYNFRCKDEPEGYVGNVLPCILWDEDYSKEDYVGDDWESYIAHVNEVRKQYGY